MSKRPSRITIIPPIHGKITRDGKVSEPDIHYMLEKWLHRHPLMKGKEKDIRIVRGRYTTKDGLRTDVINASIVWNQEMSEYDPAVDMDLYEYYLAEDRYWQDD